MKLIVGLGNPGKEYEKTRHNIWFMVVDDFLEHGKWEVESRTCLPQAGVKGELQEIVVDDQKIFFLKPMEFMNRSWSAVSIIANFYKIEPKNILIIHDDIDLPIGKIQWKLWWSSAGHNWLKSIIEKTWTKDFWRLRIGIGRPAYQHDVAEYVLHDFSKEENQIIGDKMSEIDIIIQQFIRS